MIENSTWPDTATKSKALRKARNLRPNLIAPSIYFNNTFVDETVAKVKLIMSFGTYQPNHSFFENKQGKQR